LRFLISIHPSSISIAAILRATDLCLKALE
jgi:hypothetical protein